MPPVSSRTTIMSTPFSTSGRCVDAPSSLSLTATGRRFAYRPRPLRMASRPCSGRTLARGPSHFGPPTAPSSTASAARADACVAAGRAVPVASIAAPPISASRVSNWWPKRWATAARTFRASLVTSGPIPSPGRTVMTARMGRGLYRAIRSSQGGRRWSRAARCRRCPQGFGPPVARERQGGRPRSAAPGLRDGHAAAGTEGLARDLQAGRHLAALVFAQADPPDHVRHHSRVEASRHQGVTVPPPLQVGLQARVQYVIGRQGVLVGLIGAQLGRGGLGQGGLWDAWALNAARPRQAVDQGL